MALPSDALAALAEVKRRYVAGLPERLARIAELWQRLEPWQPAAGEDFHRLLHGLCGSGASFGFAAISAAARQAETIAKACVQAARAPAGDERAQLAAALRELDAAVLAAVREGAPPPAANADAAPAATRPAPVIALAEGDPERARFLTEQMVAAGYAVEARPTLGELRRLFAQRHFAAIVAAIELPDGDAAAFFREFPPQAPLIFIGGRGDFATGLRAVRAGACHQIPDPIDAGVLIDRLHDLADMPKADPYRVLLVDDSPEVGAFHAGLLQAQGMFASALDDPTRVAEAIAERQPDVLVLDMYMPQCSGLEVARVLRMREEYLGLPIMFLSAERDITKQAAALGLGADDFLTKPVEPRDFVSAVTTRARRARSVRARMLHDGLTGLLNHTAIEVALQREVSRAERAGLTLAVAMVDVDHFKRVNDVYGHPVGDEVLRSLGRMLRQRLRGGDLVGRYGGEEFLLVMPGADGARAAQVIDALRGTFGSIHHAALAQTFQCSFSAGVAQWHAGQTTQALVKAADAALYGAKESGRNRVVMAGT